MQKRYKWCHEDALEDSVVMPCDIWLKILTFCDPQTASTLLMVCQDLYNVVTGEAANWCYWQPLYASLAYGDTHRIYNSVRPLASCLTNQLDNRFSCYWNEDFRRGVQRIRRIDLTGLWHLCGEHSFGLAYRYVMEIRQVGMKIYCITTQPFISVTFGKLRGSMLTMKQFCKDPLQLPPPPAPLATPPLATASEEVPEFRSQRRSRSLSYTESGSRPRVGAISLRRRELLQRTERTANVGTVQDVVIESTPSRRAPYTPEAGVETPEAGVETPEAGVEIPEAGVGIPENGDDWDILEQVPSYLSGTAPWSHQWLLNFLNVDPESFFLLPSLSWDWANICSAVVEGSRMRGTWIQEVSGLTLLEDTNTGWFEAVKVER